jgi:hypothetical protein
MVFAKPLGKLDPVDLRNYWRDEARDFTVWLASSETLELLSDTLGIELELESTEVSVGPYKADIVARDISSDAKVVIENQLEKTNHDHLGKILTYASGLNATVMIWIAREFTEEHRRALDFINENASPNLRCYGIEMQLWRIGNSEPAPMFKVISSPNEYTTEIKTDTSSGGLTETKALYLDFWNSFRSYCKDHGTSLKLRKPRAQHWYSFSVGRSKFHISLTASLQNRRLGCEIYMRGKNAKTAYRLLNHRKDEIEANLGTLDWMELPTKQDCRIILRKKDVSISDKNVWNESFAWLKEQAEAFYKTFSPIIRSLPIQEINEEEINDSLEE